MEIGEDKKTVHAISVQGITWKAKRQLLKSPIEKCGNPIAIEREAIPDLQRGDQCAKPGFFPLGWHLEEGIHGSRREKVMFDAFHVVFRESSGLSMGSGIVVGSMRFEKIVVSHIA